MNYLRCFMHFLPDAMSTVLSNRGIVVILRVVLNYAANVSPSEHLRRRWHAVANNMVDGGIHRKRVSVLTLASRPCL